MRVYRNKNTDVTIGQEEYNIMSYSERNNYREINAPTPSSNGDFLTSAVIAGVTDSALLGGFIGGDILGGMVGDMFDGDLMD